MREVTPTPAGTTRADQLAASGYDALGAAGAFDSILEPVLVVNAAGVVVFANRACLPVLGYHPAELTGQPVELLVPAELRAAHRAHRAGYLDQPAARPMGLGMDLWAVRRDGSTVPVQISLATLASRSGPLTTAVIRDLTTEHAERRLRGEAADRERQAAARDARIATILQAGLTPSVPQRVGPARIASRYRTAGNGEIVGGDWLDVFAIPGGRIGLTVGDVAGHGVESAATMTRLRELVRMLATSGLRPSDTVGRVNDTICAPDTDAGPDLTMATMVHGQLDPADGTLRTCTAGHPPLLVLAPPRRHGGRRAVTALAGPDGPPVGVVPGQSYREQRTVLQPGSCLIGFTDGLIERPGVPIDRAVHTLVRGIAALPAGSTAAVEVLADAVLGLAPGPSRDDTAVMALAIDQP